MTTNCANCAGCDCPEPCNTVDCTYDVSCLGEEISLDVYTEAVAEVCLGDDKVSARACTGTALSVDLL